MSKMGLKKEILQRRLLLLQTYKYTDIFSIISLKTIETSFLKRLQSFGNIYSFAFQQKHLFMENYVEIKQISPLSQFCSSLLSTQSWIPSQNHLIGIQCALFLHLNSSSLHSVTQSICLNIFINNSIYQQDNRIIDRPR